MKKSKIILSLSLASLTVLTGCKGSKITGEAAIKRADEIISATDYSDLKALTYNVSVKGTEEGEKVSANIVVKFDSEKKVAYSYSKSYDGGKAEVSETYIGIKDNSFYTFDVQSKTYTVVSIGAEAAWKVASTAVLAGVTTTLSATQTGILETVKANESLEADKKSNDVVAYSSGKGAMAIETVTEKDDDGKVLSTSTVYIKGNKVAKVVDKSGSVTSTTTVKYSASVKLPSTSGYTKK